MPARPQSTTGAQLKPPDPRPKYGRIVSVGRGFVLVVMGMGGAPHRMVCTGGAPAVDVMVEVVDVAGTLTARIPWNL